MSGSGTMSNAYPSASRWRRVVAVIALGFSLGTIGECVNAFWTFLLPPLIVILPISTAVAALIAYLCAPAAAGRASTRRLVREQLPSLAADRVLDVVRHTGLTSREKHAVALELIDHFREGLGAGADAETLVERFGDPAQAARLIRRAKLRCRPLHHRLFSGACRAILIGTPALLCLYAIYTLLFVYTEPFVEVDYVGQLTAPASPVSLEQTAWPLYREARAAMGVELPVFRVSEDASLNKSPFPDDPEWAQAVAYLDAHPRALPLIRKAASNPVLGHVTRAYIPIEDRVFCPAMKDETFYQPVEATSAYTLRTPPLEDFLMMGYLLVVDTRRAVLDADGERVVANIEALFGMARQLRPTPFLINHLVGLAIAQLALAEVGRAAAETPGALSDAQWIALAHHLSAADDALSIGLRGERMITLDILQRLYNRYGLPNGKGFEILGGPNLPASFREIAGHPEKVLMPGISLLFASKSQILARANRLWDRNEAQVGKPLWEMDTSSVDDELEKMGWLERQRYMPLRAIYPSVGRANVLAQQAIAQRDAVLVAIALTLHHKRTGNWPATLDELTPTYLPEVPPDRFSGQPMRYRLIDGQPLLYSVGTDRDDDGGRMMLDPRSQKPTPGAAIDYWLPLSKLTPDFKQLYDGDWILWPLPRE